MKYDREGIKRNLILSEIFINRIDYLTDYSKFNYCKNKNESELTNKSNPLLANGDCRFLGRYYLFSNGIKFWIGYDFRKSEHHKFYISIFAKNDVEQKKIESKLQNYEKIISEIDSNKPWYNIYLDEALIYLQNMIENSDENKYEARSEILEKLKNIEKSLIEI